MKVAIGNTVLVEGLRESDENPETAMTCDGQVARLFRASEAKVYSRGNRVYAFAFSKTREHANFQAAERFRIMHPAEVPATGILRFVTEDGVGGEANLYFATHNVDQVSVRQIGVSTITTYRITAAGPTTVRPTA